MTDKRITPTELFTEVLKENPGDLALLGQLSADNFMEALRKSGFPKMTFNEAQRWLDENYPGFAVFGGYQQWGIYDDKGCLLAWSSGGSVRIRGSLHQYGFNS